MREEEFTRYLEEDPAIDSKDKAVKSRVSKARRVEREFNVDLDQVVTDNERTFNILLMIRNQLGDRNGAIQNSVRKYYAFINDTEFPSLSKYQKAMS